MKWVISGLVRVGCAAVVVAMVGNTASAQVIATDEATFTFVVGDNTPAPGGLPEWVEEHGDIGIGFEGGDELELHYHFEEGLNGMGATDVEFEPNELVIRVNGRPEFTTTDELTFLGIGANANGTPFWLLPENSIGPLGAETLDLPFVGLATEELDPLVFGSVDLTLTDFQFTGTGDGQFAVWQNSLTGPNVFMQTVDGIAADDSLTLGIGIHSHLNYGFSAPGVYEVTLAASAVAVPEPSSLSSLALLGTAGALVRRRRSRS